MIQLENIDSWLQEWDVFINTWTSDCWEAILLKIDEDTNPCPSWNSIFSSTLSWGMNPWCYNGTETIEFVSSTLTPSNIKSWVNILWVEWTFAWFWWIDGVNIIIPEWQTSTIIPWWNYDGSETVVASDVDLLPQNIKKDINVFWVTWTYEWELPDLFWQNMWYHTWHTFWRPSFFPSWYPQYSNIMYATWVGVTWDANNVYLCYSAKSDWWTYWLLYHKVLRYNNWVISVISNFSETWWSYFGMPTFFTTWNSWSDKFWIIYWQDSTIYSYIEVTISTWWVIYGNVSKSSSIWSNLPSSFTQWWFTYSPILVDTNNSSTENSLACNVNII